MIQRFADYVGLSLVILVLVGCNSTSRAQDPAPSARSKATAAPQQNVAPAGSQTTDTSSTANSSSTGTGTSHQFVFLTEPQAGISPWTSAIANASTEIMVNDYLLTDSTLVQSLKVAAKRGVTVDIIIDGHPYHDPTAPSQTRTAFSGSKVQLKFAPTRFEGSYSFDHAKYMVIDPGKVDQLAILGSPNGTASAFDGYNAEDAVQTKNQRIISALAKVFQADWHGSQAGSTPRRYLVLSPGSTSSLTDLLQTSGPVAITSEELGDVPELYAAIESHGSQARVLLPANPTYSDLSRASQLEAAHVQIRTISYPYIHAKLIVGQSETFVGSQNFSEPSLVNNREVGIISSDPTLHSQALNWFNSLWNSASPLVGSAPTSSSTTTPTTVTIPTTVPAPPAPAPAPAPSGQYPYLPDGDTEAEVQSLWGSPTSTGSTSYDGYPETVWHYPGGSVYFNSSGTVTYVTRGSGA